MQVPKHTLERLPQYLNYLKARKKDGCTNISAPLIAEGLRLNEVQVRKDLALVSSGGKPKIGYHIDDLISDIRCFLGYDNVDTSILVGVGKIGKALLSYEGFKEYGLDIIAGFDIDENLVGTEINGKRIFELEKVKDLCSRLNIYIGIIAVPADNAQRIADILIESGVRAIWNFAPVHLEVPQDIIVQNENMALTLALLSKHLAEKMKNHS